MSLPSNLKQQIARRLKQKIEKAHAELAVSFADDTTLAISKAGATIALARLQSKSFNGFNILAELSSSAGEGQPETDLMLAIAATASVADQAKVVAACAKVGVATLKIIETAGAPVAADLAEANVSAEIAADAHLGHVGV